MMQLALRVGVLATSLLCLVQGMDPPAYGEDSPGSARSGEYIIEYDFGASSPLRAVKRASLLEGGVEVVREYDSAVFSGAQVIADDYDLDQLLAVPGVVRAWHNQPISLLAPVERRQQPVPPGNASQHDVHWATGVRELHDRGILGKGVKIGVIDTGIHYHHAALGSGGFGAGQKVAGGWDFVGDGWVPGSVRKPDGDPADEQGHGTHVAGIIAGQATETGWQGVAPEASLYAYKVFGTSGSTDNSIVIEAFLRAYEDGMDIITASLGSASGFPDNPLALIANRIAATGTIVTVAAGNSGSGGPFYAANGGAGDLTLSVASADVAKLDGATTLQPSSFTSWGALYDLSVKPDVAAPGRNVYSSWIGSDNNSYALVSGTSMATPYVAGVAALYLSILRSSDSLKIPREDLARHVNMRIMASGSSLPWVGLSGEIDADFKASPYQVGTGLVNALKVIDSEVSFDLQRFALNDTRRTRRHQSLTIRNDGATKLSFTFELEAAAGFEILQDAYDIDFPTEFPRIKAWRELSPIKAEAGLESPDRFELDPGKSSQARFVFDVPQGLNATALPIYSGKVLVKASNGDSLSVPFQGLGFDLKSEMQDMSSGTYPWLRAGFPPKDETRFTLDLSVGVQSYPKIFSKIKWGTRELRWDIYQVGFQERHWRYPPVVGELGYVGSATSWAYGNQVAQFNPARHNASDIITFPLRDQTRNALVSGSFTSTYYWFGKLANGTVIAPGDYTIRYAALKPFSEPQRSDSWDVFTKDITLAHSLT